MKNLFLVISPKGGVSKSFTAKFIYEVMKEKYGKENVTLVDCDHNVRAISKVYPEAISIDLRSDAGRQNLVRLGKDNANNMLVDFAGGSIHEIQELFTGEKDPSLFFDMFKGYGYSPVIIFPFTYEVNSQVAMKDVHAAFGAFGTNATFFFVQSLKGISREDEHGPYFEGYNGTLENIDKHPQYINFVPEDFAIKHLGLDTTARDDFGTTANLVRVPQMPGNVAIWCHDGLPFNEEAVLGYDPLIQSVSIRFFNKVKNRFLASDLLK